MFAAVAIDEFPALDGVEGRGFGEDVLQDATVHVLPGRKSVAGENGGCDVEQVGALDHVAGPDVRAGGHEDPVVTVFLGGACRFVGELLGAKVIGVESMVGDEHHRGVLVRVFQELLQHHVVEDVSRVDDVSEQPEVIVFDVLPLWSAVPHEAVAVVVDRVVVDRREVPGVGLEQVGGGGVDRGALRRDLHHGGESTVDRLVDVGSFRYEGQDVLGLHLHRVHPEFGDLLQPFGGMDAIRPQRPGIAWFLG